MSGEQTDLNDLKQAVPQTRKQRVVRRLRDFSAGIHKSFLAVGVSEFLAVTFVVVFGGSVRELILTYTALGIAATVTLLSLGMFLTYWASTSIFGYVSAIYNPVLTIAFAGAKKFSKPGNTGLGWVILRTFLIILIQWAGAFVGSFILLAIWGNGTIGTAHFDLFGIATGIFDPGFPIASHWRGVAGIAFASFMIAFGHLVLTIDGWTANPAAAVGALYGISTLVTSLHSGGETNPVFQFVQSVVSLIGGGPGIISSDWIYIVGSGFGVAAAYLVYILVVRWPFTRGQENAMMSYQMSNITDEAGGPGDNFDADLGKDDYYGKSAPVNSQGQMGGLRLVRANQNQGGGRQKGY